MEVRAIVLVSALPFPTPREYVEALRGARIDCHLLLKARRPPRSRFQEFCCGPLVSIQEVGQFIAFQNRAALVRTSNQPEELIAYA